MSQFLCGTGNDGEISEGEADLFELELILDPFLFGIFEVAPIVL